MRRNLRHIITFVAILCSHQLMSQDIHFSQVFATPLFNNPGMTGLMNGDLRAAAIYRNFSIGPGSGYQTISGSVDGKLLNVSGDDDWLSGGLMLYSDRAGALSFRTNSFNLSAAYNVGLGGSAHHISVGIMGGMTQRSLDLSQAQFGNQYDGSDFNPGMGSNESIMDQQYWFPNVAAGLMYYYLSGRRTYLYAGASVYHLSSPQNAFLSVGSETERMKLQFIAGGSLPIFEGIDLVPSVYGAWQEIYSQVNVGTSFRFNMMGSAASNQSAISLGAHVRLSDFMHDMLMDAVIAMAKIEWESFTIGLSYDITVSELRNANNGSGAFEASIVYELNGGERKNGSRGGKVNCPRF